MRCVCLRSWSRDLNFLSFPLLLLFQEMTASEFDAATQLQVISSSPTELLCQGNISDQWNLGATPEGFAINPFWRAFFFFLTSLFWAKKCRLPGGYLFALLLKSISVFFEKQHPHPFTATAYYLAKPDHGPCEFKVTLMKRGSSYSTAQSTLLQRGEVRLQMVATFTDLARRKGPTVEDVGAPEMPPVEECP